ncbi:pyruvate kinase [bacterium]|nr:pyruvate kinase [bacterium]
MRQTKIVCTLGPAVESQKMVAGLIKEGMNLARLNCSHGDWEGKRKFIEWIKAESPDLAPVGIMADLQGPKTRLGVLAGGAITFDTGASTTIGLGEEMELPVGSPELVASMRKGDRILLGDGQVELKLLSGEGTRFTAKVVAGGTVKTKQGVTIVGRSFDIPALTTKDLGDITQAIEAGCDYIALSYVRSAADMRELRDIVDRLDPSVKLVAKIETREALKEIDAIISLSDVIMVARGDLGLQMEVQDVPAAQKKIIARCNRAAVPVITATQMLESMITTSRPTRAEASDVANAILDGTDAVMLSGETASGEYPLEAVRTMASIARATESHVKVHTGGENKTGVATDVVAESAVAIARGVKAKAILTTSASGKTPCMVSKYRPDQPIFVACWSERVQRQLCVVRGVFALVVDPPLNTDDAIRATVTAFLRRKLIGIGDQVVVTAGVPVGQPGNTNLIQVLTV